MKMPKISLPVCALAVLSFTVSPMAYAHDAGTDKESCLPMSRTGNADVDFIRSMIPHHEMALRMAESELRNGRNAAAKKMARKIIEAQKREVSILKSWLQAHPI